MTFMEDVEAEVDRARTKFPKTAHLLAALVEEVGEVATALMEDEDDQAVRAECVQVAAMAMRIAEEGDADYEGGA